MANANAHDRTEPLTLLVLVVILQQRQLGHSPSPLFLLSSLPVVALLCAGLMVGERALN